MKVFGALLVVILVASCPLFGQADDPNAGLDAWREAMAEYNRQAELQRQRYAADRDLWQSQFEEATRPLSTGRKILMGLQYAGDKALTGLVNYYSNRAAIRSEMGRFDQRFDALRGDVLDSRNRILSGVEGSRTDVLAGIASSRTDVLAGIAGSRTDVLAGIASSRTDVLAGIAGSTNHILAGIGETETRIRTDMGQAATRIVTGITDSEGRILTGITDSEGRVLTGITDSEDRVRTGITDSEGRILTPTDEGDTVTATLTSIGNTVDRNQELLDELKQLTLPLCSSPFGSTSQVPCRD